MQRAVDTPVWITALAGALVFWLAAAQVNQWRGRPTFQSTRKFLLIGWFVVGVLHIGLYTAVTIL